MDSTSGTFEEVKDVLVETLGIQDRAATLTPSTELFGSLPELDSMAVLEVVEAIESRFGLEVEDSELVGDVFETLGSLTTFVASKRGG
jgi:acyl carrier protein